MVAGEPLFDLVIFPTLSKENASSRELRPISDGKLAVFEDLRGGGREGLSAGKTGPAAHAVRIESRVDGDIKDCRIVRVPLPLRALFRMMIRLA